MGRTLKDRKEAFQKELEQEAINCVVCEKEFMPRSPRSRYCSRACQQSAYRDRKTKGEVVSAEIRAEEVKDKRLEHYADYDHNTFYGREGELHPERFCTCCGSWYFPDHDSGLCAICRGLSEEARERRTKV